MKYNFLFLSAIMCLAVSSRAQLYIQNGAELATSGKALITLESTDLINLGGFKSGKGSLVLFSGAGNNSVVGMGTANAYFDSIQLTKPGTDKLLLQQASTVQAAVIFSSGFLDLNNNNLLLDSSASLLNENENSRIIGASGGFVEITKTLNAPTAANPGNLGAIVTSTQNLGSTTIRRGHKSQVNSVNSGSSILRFYDILPSNNSGLNASLKFLYFDGELNALSESALCLWKSKDTIQWKNEGYASKSAASNFVEQSGIPDFSRWTLSSMSNPLPLILTNFSGKCDGGKAQLSWQIASSVSVVTFEVQRSEDGAHWEHAANIAVQNGQYDYQFQNTNGGQFFKLIMIGRDGTRQSSKVLQVACGGGVEDLSLYPNPVATATQVKVTTHTASTLELQIFGANGALILNSSQQLQPGIQEFVLPLAQLVPGVYWLKARWADGGYQKMIQFVKQ